MMCTGNRRGEFNPDGQTAGLPWKNGSISTVRCCRHLMFAILVVFEIQNQALPCALRIDRIVIGSDCKHWYRNQQSDRRTHFVYSQFRRMRATTTSSPTTFSHRNTRDTYPVSASKTIITPHTHPTKPLRPNGGVVTCPMCWKRSASLRPTRRRSWATATSPSGDSRTTTSPSR